MATGTTFLKACRFTKVSTFKRLFSSNYDGIRPRRSLLYVPGNEIKKIEKTLSLKADCVVLDCEDGVAINKKDEARASIKTFLNNLPASTNEYLVRINPIGSGLAEDDIDVLLSGSKSIQGIVVPKLENVDEVSKLYELVEKSLQKYGKSSDPPLIFIGMIETALGMINIKSIVGRTVKPSSTLSCQAFIFGSDDYLASIGATRMTGATNLTFARQNFVTHTKAFKLQAIDMVYINFKDAEGLKQQAEEGANIGFTGKQIIHPNQVDIVNASFSPSKEAIDQAQQLIDAFDEHQNKGQGAFVFKGAMIDMPSIKQAQNVLRLQEHMNN